MLLCGTPPWETWSHRQHHRPVLKRMPLPWTPSFRVDSQHPGHGRDRFRADATNISRKFSRHAPIHAEGDIPGRKGVPRSGSWRTSGSFHVVKQMGFRQLLQYPSWRSIPRIFRNLQFFLSRECFQSRVSRPESELSIKPESARIQCLVVVLSNLIWINGNSLCPGKRTQTPQRLRVDPRGLSLPVGIKRVEPDLDPLAESDCLDVVDRDAILYREPGDVRAQRQAPFRGQVPQVDHNAATNFGPNHRSRIGKRRSIKLPIPNQHYFPDEPDYQFSFADRHFFQNGGWPRELLRERDLLARNQRL